MIWMFIVYTPGFTGVVLTIAFILQVVFTVLGLFPPEASPIYWMTFIVLIFVFYCGTLAPISQAVTRVRSQNRSFKNNSAPFRNKKPIKKMQSAINSEIFFLPIAAAFRAGIYGAIDVALASSTIAALFSGLLPVAIGFALATVIFHVIGGSILSGFDVLGAKVNQIEKDAQLLYRNLTLAEVKEGQIELHRRALEEKEEAHQQRLEEKRLREQARKRDLAQRRKDSFNSTMRKIVAYFK